MDYIKYERIHLVILDSLGIGEAPDAALFNDEGANTLGHIAEQMNGLKLRGLDQLGLSHISDYKGRVKLPSPLGSHGKMKPASVGKDTMTGHWELMGLNIDKPFRTFPNGFPQELLDELERRTGRKSIGNKPASGTVILDELGDEHVRTGDLIVYTSADSVLQIAAHEEVVPLEELYSICEVARELTLDEKYMVGRVIARPFVGRSGDWQRTTNRHDYALKPFGRTVMNELVDNGWDSIAIGKIHDIFDGEGITHSIRTVSNSDGIDKLEEVMAMDFQGLSFLNLVDFDALYGHRRDPIGYGKALEEFDARLADIIDSMRVKDLLIITADHGNDPVHHGTDHTREYVPLLTYSHLNIKTGSLGERQTFADVGATIAHNFRVPLPKYGTSFLYDLK